MCACKILQQVIEIILKMYNKIIIIIWQNNREPNLKNFYSKNNITA